MRLLYDLPFIPHCIRIIQTWPLLPQTLITSTLSIIVFLPLWNLPKMLHCEDHFLIFIPNVTISSLRQR